MPLKKFASEVFLHTYVFFLSFHKNKSYNLFAFIFQIPFPPLLFYYCYLFVPKRHEERMAHSPATHSHTLGLQC